MVLSAVTQSVINPAMLLLPPTMDSPKARVELLAIGLQESGFVRTVQEGNGPAHGFWQFEQNGVRGVLSHPLSGPYVKALCEKRKTSWSVVSIWNSLMYDQVMACCFARLLLFTDPAPLPQVDDEVGGWEYYLRNWRPGAPRPHDWPANHTAAFQSWGGQDAA